MARPTGSTARKHLEAIERQLAGTGRRFETRSISLSPELLAELDAAAATLYRNNRSFLISEALEAYLAQLRKLHTGGKPFRMHATDGGRLNRKRPR